MSAVEELAEIQTGDLNPLDASIQLGVLLGLPGRIRGGRIVGEGSRASAEIVLDGGVRMRFETLRDLANPKTLSLEIVACTGVTTSIKASAAMQAIRLLRFLAEHEEAVTVDQISREWGITYLQSATVHRLDMDDGAARWDAFCALEQNDAITKAKQGAISVAQASTVLQHSNGARFVRCGWFRAHVRQEDSSLSPQQIANRMQMVGWGRRGKTGRIKATRPKFGQPLAWSFYVVPAGWEAEE